VLAYVVPINRPQSLSLHLESRQDHRQRRSVSDVPDASTGINTAELERLWRWLQPLGVSDVPLDVPPPRTSRFGSPLVLSRVHWVRPELVAEVKFLSWTDDNLLRQVVYEGLRDNPAAEVRQPVPHPNRPW
jgi:ATP-dependent DNA ligase